MLYTVRVWEGPEVYEYEYGCLKHALEHIQDEKCLAKLYCYNNGMETLIEDVDKTNDSIDSGDNT